MKKHNLLDSKDIKYLIKLANLHISDTLINKFLPPVIKVLDFMSKIQQIDTKNVEETSQVTGQENVFRADEIDEKRMLTQKEALSNAKKSHNGYFVVKAIFE